MYQKRKQDNPYRPYVPISQKGGAGAMEEAYQKAMSNIRVPSPRQRNKMNYQPGSYQEHNNVKRIQMPRGPIPKEIVGQHKA